MRGVIPGGINPELVALTGAIVTWWGRIEGSLVYDLISLRLHPACANLAKKERFPVQTGRVIEQWASTRRLVFADKEHKLAELDELHLDLIACADERNKIVHYFWPYGGIPSRDQLKLQSIKTKRRTHDTLEFASHMIDVASMNDFNDRLCHLYHRVMVSGLQLLVGPDHISPPTRAPQDSLSTADK